MSNSILLLLLIFNITSLASLNKRDWSSKELADYANENFSPAQNGIYDPEHLIEKKDSIVNNMNLLYSSKHISAYLFIVNHIDCDCKNDKDDDYLEEYVSKLSKFLIRPHYIKDDNTVIMLYSVKLGYLAFHIGEDVYLTEDNVDYINNRFRFYLQSGNYSVFKDIINTIKQLTTENEKRKSATVIWASVGGCVGLLVVIIAVIILFCICKRDQTQEKHGLITTEGITHGFATSDDETVNPTSPYDVPPVCTGENK